MAARERMKNNCLCRWLELGEGRFKNKTDFKWQKRRIEDGGLSTLPKDLYLSTQKSIKDLYYFVRNICRDFKKKGSSCKLYKIGAHQFQ